MPRGRLMSVIALAAATSVAALITLVGAAAPVNQAANPFDALRSRYARVHSIHFLASATMWREPVPGVQRSGNALFEFWADTNRYRISCSSDPNLGLMGDVEIAFDGQNWQYLDRESQVLRLLQKDVPQAPTAIHNPLFLPLEFLNPDGDSCRGCTTRLQDLQDARLWSNRLRAVRRFPNRDGEADRAAEFEVQGGDSESTPAKVLVRLAKIQGAVAPIAIKRLAADGKAISEIVPTEFRTVDKAVGPLPSQLIVRAFAPAGQTVMESEINLQNIEVNQPIAPNVFTIDWKEAEAVWDSDAGAFIKHPDPRLVNVPLDQIRRQKRDRS